jgi:hypothetical protein
VVVAVLVVVVTEVAAVAVAPTAGIAGAATTLVMVDGYWVQVYTASGMPAAAAANMMVYLGLNWANKKHELQMTEQRTEWQQWQVVKLQRQLAE